MQLSKLLRIGRDAKNDYVVDRLGVSAFHAQLHAVSLSRHPRSGES